MLGATWISEDYITRFMAETFHTPRYYVGSKVKVQYSPVPIRMMNVEGEASIAVESIPGKGTEFSLRFPLEI